VKNVNNFREMVCGHRNSHTGFAERQQFEWFRKYSQKCLISFRRTDRFRPICQPQEKFPVRFLTGSNSDYGKTLRTKDKRAFPVGSHTVEYWLINRGPGILAIEWLGFIPTPSPVASYLSQSCASPVELTDETRGWGRSQKYDREKPWSSIIIDYSQNPKQYDNLKTLTSKFLFYLTNWIKYFFRHTLLTNDEKL
jgi:hypothetical protein